ncbi:uncharacterized protein LOC133302456 isoform X2 [Gastrolobium bilobum]|uniref:uncharacterized protein LOC133302456 isoform X2 n=1 Tax=Gastrolobium bilobum TaxID=150636 RepID=UPI002AB16C05|nr:uncharacterized protein LOC133302456 isoform X2 [Gastrolobium bilobum]
MEDDNNNGGATTRRSKHRKRKEYKLDDDGHVAAREKLAKRILLSLAKPSYVLGLAPKPLRSEHRTRLRYLLQRLVKQHNWVEASGVLSAYLKGTVNDTSPFRNRLKFSVLLELLKHVESHSINPSRIKNIYDIWSKKIGSMKSWPVESRYAVQLEFMLFCLMQGNTGDAYQLALCLEQEKVDIDPVSKIMMGLTFYEMWYSSIPKEFQWRDSDQYDMQENSHMEGASYSNEVRHSVWHNTVESHMEDSQYQCDSDSSVMNDKQIPRDVGFNEDMGVSMEVDVNNEREKQCQNFQPEGFYLNSDEQKEIGDNGVLTHDTLYALVKYLQQALNSTPSGSVALLPLIQLLLIGGQVDEALNILEKQCCSSASVLPIRLRAALLERFDRNKSLFLLSCYEDILKKDPTCCGSLTKLIRMHENGDYSLESLLEMIASHLDATDAEYNTWRVFSSCFFRLSHYEEDCMSACPGKHEDGHRQHCSFSKTPTMFTKISGKSWRLRCRWWLTRHFSNSKLESEIEAGDLQLLAYKAACASYMYGQEFSYVAKAYSHLEKENDKDLLLFLDEHKKKSFGFYKKFQKKAIYIT